jgi:hypothetical protein
METWFEYLEGYGFSDLNWLQLDDESVKFDTIKRAFQKFCSKKDKDLDGLFTEVTELNELQKILNAKDDLNFKSKTVEEKWAIILTNNNLVKLRTLVAKLLSIYSSNAYVESVFSIVNGIWSDERNRFKPKTVNAIASVKCNSDLTCAQAYDLFLSDNDLLDKAKSSEKYN